MVAVTLTDPATDEVIAASEPVVVDSPQDVSQAAIGEIVDTVVDAAESSGPSASDAIPSEDVAIVEEAQKEAPTESEAALVVPDPAVREDQSALALVS
ncbi:hypothetical protein [Streptomyces sp. NPDC057909]|uniref:hypothetical protein n=1 Tax=Streptomyces sp. NPDC057909 TaxID=3346277 RepID=UPI0036E48567